MSNILIRNLTAAAVTRARNLENLPSNNFSTSAGRTANKIQNVTVLGAGLMGSGIAQVTAQAGVNVNLVDVSTDILDRAKNNITQSLQRIAKKQFKDDPSKGAEFIKSSLSFVKFSDKRDSAVANSDLVIEAIVENLGIKQKVFGEINKVAPKHTIFASNTSSLPIKEIAESTPDRKDRFGGLHFFSPVPMMKLLEVVRIPETSDETYESMLAFGKQIGKVTVSCKDTPGFIVNRLLIPYSLEATRMYERGDASFEDIDTAMKLGAGYPMGPFELTDFTGLDLALFINEGWEKRFPDNPSYKTPEIIKKKVAEGKLGRKSGEGFYKYNK